jgi:hypothetical protein
VTRRAVLIFDRVSQFRFWAAIAARERRLSVALPVAATATAAAPPATSPLAGLSFAERTGFLARLWLTQSLFFG